MRLFSYIVTGDLGFSPNPFWGYCTLADCKPMIRKTARVGDWIVGLSPKADGNAIIYAMRVDEVLPYEAYYRDPRFASKIPDPAGPGVRRRGDNIYEPIQDGFRQLQSMHSNGAKENLEKKSHDLRGRNALVSQTFYYFGSKPLPLPTKFSDVVVGRAHKNNFPPTLVNSFLNFITKQQAGVHAPPTTWPPNDESWRATP